MFLLDAILLDSICQSMFISDRIVIDDNRLYQKEFWGTREKRYESKEYRNCKIFCDNITKIASVLFFNHLFLFLLIIIIYFYMLFLYKIFINYFHFLAFFSFLQSLIYLFELLCFFLLLKKIWNYNWERYILYLNFEIYWAKRVL